MDSSSKILAIVGKNSGRGIVKSLWQGNYNLSDVFVLAPEYSIKGSGYRSFDDLFYKTSQNTRLHKIHTIKENVELIRDINPNLIIMNFSEILGKEVLDIPDKGVVGFHYAKLPDRRGCNPDMWALIHGLNKSCVTLHYYNERIDTGDIIGESWFDISFRDDSKSVLDKINQRVVSLLEFNLESILLGNASRKKQFGPGIYTPRRTFEDGEILWSRMTAPEIYNLVRALRPPYGGAYSLAGLKNKKEKIYILSADLVNPQLIIPHNLVLNWTDSVETIHRQVLDFPRYSLTGNGLIQINETRVGEIEE
jgi:methionyl-tRNA formyltransferase